MDGVSGDYYRSCVSGDWKLEDFVCDFVIFFTGCVCVLVVLIILVE